MTYTKNTSEVYSEEYSSIHFCKLASQFAAKFVIRIKTEEELICKSVLLKIGDRLRENFPRSGTSLDAEICAIYRPSLHRNYFSVFAAAYVIGLGRKYGLVNSEGELMYPLQGKITVDERSKIEYYKGIKSQFKGV